MSSNSNVSDLLKKKREREQAKVEAEAEVAPVSVEVDGDLPEKAAQIGDVVLLTWGDPQLVGGPTFDVTLVITLTDPANGRVNGQMITDPTMQGMDARGRPVPLAPIVPVANVPYSSTPRPLTWRHKGA
jgi:hypothetical protein